MNPAHEQICRHVEKHFGPVRPNGLGDFKPDIGVSIHLAGPVGNRVTLFTTGLSDFPMTVPEGQEAYQHAELFIHLPSDWPLQRSQLRDPANLWPIEWLRTLSEFPRENNTWLGGPSTIVANGEPPEPLGPNTRLSSLLLLEDGELGKVRLADGREVIFYSLVPIYSEERQFEMNSSLKELLERFNQHNVSNVVQVDRVNAGV